MPMTAEQKRAKRAAEKAQREAAAVEARKAGQKTEIEKAADAAALRPDLVAAGNVMTPSQAGAKVTVGCKLGVAYFDIQLCKIEDKFEQNMQGGRTIKEATRIGPKVRLRGTAYPRGQVPDGFPDRPRIIGGAAMNPNVDKSFWDAWLEQNRLNPLVQNGMIFAHEDDAYVAGQAKETSGLLSGLEPLDPKNLKKDPRIPRSTRTELTNIETEEARAKKASISA